jgi:hypothetical protein
LERQRLSRPHARLIALFPNIPIFPRSKGARVPL